MKYISYTALGLAILQLLTILVSWLITAAMPDAMMRSLLSSEGIRWFFGSFTDNMLSPLMLWMILIALSVSVFRASGLSLRVQTYRQRFALRLVLGELLVILSVWALLTMIPHAILLSASGRLFPSSASDSLIPVLCAMLFIISATYGLASGSFCSVHDVTRSLSAGSPLLLPLLLVYILTKQLIASIVFVWGLSGETFLP